MAPSPWRAATSPSSWSTARACRSSPACRSPSSLTAVLGAVLERTLYVHVYAQEPSRPGAVHHRPRLHVGRGGRLLHGLVAAVRADPGGAAGPVRRVRRRHRPLPPADHRRLRPAHARAAVRPDEDALRQPAARRGRRSAGGARARHQCRRGVRHHLRGRLRPRRPRRRARRRDPRPRSDLSAQIHDLLPDRRHGRRHLEHHRAVPRLDPARHRRRRRQVLRAARSAPS